MALFFAGIVLGGLTFGAATFVVLQDFMYQEPGGWPLIGAGIGALFGLFFSRMLFDGALIVISAAVGAILLMRSFSEAWFFSPAQEGIGTLILFLAGLAAQTSRKARKPPKHDE